MSREDIESGDYSTKEVVNAENELWARIENVSGTAQVDSRNSGSGFTHTITIRFRYDVTIKNYFLYQDPFGNKCRYEIQTIQNLVDDGNTWLICDCLQLEKAEIFNNPSPETDE